MRNREQGGVDPCLTQGYIRKENPSQRPVNNKPVKTGEVDLRMGVQFVVNPPAKLPEGFKFGPVFV